MTLKKNRWIEIQKNWLLQSRADQVLRNLKRHLEPEGFADENAPVRVCLRYLKNRLDQLDYKAAIDAELPIGSGETESAHRHLIQRKLKLPGAWWNPRTAGNMAQLRVTRANVHWNQFWNQQAA